MTTVIPSRESAATKGRRYVCEGRLRILAVRPRRVYAECQGDGETYELGWGEFSGWWCHCPARTTCAHLIALRLVVNRPEIPRG